MPKIARERSEENRRRIEAAALELFTRQGFHGTNSREIAEKIGISTGAIYSYFPNKKAIYAELAQKYSSHVDEGQRAAAAVAAERLEKMGYTNSKNALTQVLICADLSGNSLCPVWIQD